MKCMNCPHNCDIAGDFHGICKSREKRPDGIKSLSYGQITSIALDPIEKKPLARFYPGSKILSIGSWGCNMFCPWCQNDSISRGPARYEKYTPQEIVDIAVYEKERGNIGVAYTYNEALTGSEFVLDTAKCASQAGLKNVLVTNAMASPEVFDRVLSYTDAMNIDLKTIDSGKYKKIGGDYDTIIRNIAAAAKSCHVELTTLIVPAFNDSREEMEKEAAIIAEIDESIPLHITRFFPAGDMTDAYPTSREKIYELTETASARLKYVYAGNM